MFSCFFPKQKMNMLRNKENMYMFVWATALYQYMKSHMNDILNLTDNAHMWIKIYLGFYHYIVYLANVRFHVWLSDCISENECLY
jgi:uncharacterized MAPEG superfamily protein